jgi:hypothetical protein
MKSNKGTNRILYHDIAAQTIREPPRVSMLVPDIPGSRLPWTFPNVNSSEYRKHREGRLIWAYHAFLVVWCPSFMIVTPLFKVPSITFNNQRFSYCSPAVDVVFVKLTSDSFCGKQGLQDEYSVLLSCHLCCSVSVIFRNSPSQCSIISFCRCWLSPTVPLH